MLRAEGVDGGLILQGKIDRFALDFAQALRVAVGEFDGDRAFGCNRLGFGFELFCHETVEQSNVLKPTAIIVLEQIPQNAATSLLVSIQPNELNAAIGRAHGIFREHSPDLIGLIIAGSADVLPDLLLPGVVGCNRESHELLECHAVFGIDVVELWRHRRQPEALLHDGRCHEMPGSDILVGQSGATQGLECPELIERMKPNSLAILRKRIVLSDAPSRTTQGTAWVFAMRFCLTRSSSAR